ncbi:MAG: hypothetical protein M3Y56_04495 [Armatimonadota bacterium]|nr:hypothetical protein [Armatimonadota bacterium]
MLPTPIESGNTEAYERAPTLMAGQTPGSQGQVRVWEPDRKLLRRTGLCFGMLLLNGVPVVINLIKFKPRAPCDLFLFAMLIVALVGQLFYIGWRYRQFVRQPRFVSADGVGIGVTTRDGGKYVPWTDVVSAELGSEYIILNAPDKLFIDLAGYPEGRRESLLAYICVGAGLHRSREDHRLFVRDASVRKSTPVLRVAAEPGG